MLPQTELQIFSPRELDLLLCGSPDINVADWQEHTTYQGFTKTDEAVVWFWEIVEELSPEQRVCLRSVSALFKLGKTH